ncbi:hypothetical protein PoB_005318900 [Plakobranchus ocellatus]|uniref:Uncharacterized protein n=1 Tax=Plakobranchus ocellatus TaxID=259542 RepID=A0AAV4C7K3_9GAST|nr:hypothetical protein PoB_005318900 [Plakobranchus ocellatus]
MYPGIVQHPLSLNIPSVHGESDSKQDTCGLQRLADPRRARASVVRLGDSRQNGPCNARSGYACHYTSRDSMRVYVKESGHFLVISAQCWRSLVVRRRQARTRFLQMSGQSF